ncbi:hypothetical protein F5Y19DRAFT_469241 [Xylariaceae sp. FL1651]|nr:hypothetical protein F5Y19DRAFT_469241 [Xylariaceae sp. FL1651]
MVFAMQIGAFFALVSILLVHGWNATIYDSANCTGNYYEVYPTQMYTKYFEMEGSFGAGMVCIYHGTDNTTAACHEQFPVGKSVLSSVGLCQDFPEPHSQGDPTKQEEGECKTTDFDILSVVCYDG